MSDDFDWSPSVGWRKAGLRMLTCGPVAMALTFGAVWVAVQMFGDFVRENGGNLPSFAWRFLGPLAAAAGLIGGFPVSRKLVESTGLVGLPLILGVCAGLVVANVVVAYAGLLLFGFIWKGIFVTICGTSCLVSMVLSAMLIFFDS